jgi:hypothetical protein
MADESKTAGSKAAKSKGAKSKGATSKSAKSKAKAKAPKAPKAPASPASKDKAGVGNTTHPGNKRIPAKALIRREPANPEETKVTASPEVQGDKALQIIDVLNSRPVHVSLIEGKALTKETDGRVLVIQGPVSMKVIPLVNARSLFAVKKDGTVIYNDRGFDDVPAGADFDMVDIAVLIDHNN